MLLGLSNAQASSNTFVVNAVEIPQGGSTTLVIGLDNPDYENNCYGFQFMLSLPAGVTASNVVASSRVPNDYITQISSKDGGYQVLSYNSSESVVSGTTGAIVTITLSAGEALVSGNSGAGKIQACKITTGGGSSEMINEELPFTVTIGEPADPRVVLDEESTTPPVASDGEVDVLVRRTINANEWSTIVLPFAMTEAQVKTAFGDDVELSDFTGYSYDEGNDKITVNFQDVTAIDANHPYIIKVSQRITEFTVEGVVVDPVDEPIVAAVKRTRKQWSEFIGTYVKSENWASALIEDDVLALFLSGNKFWYISDDTQTLKAFRGYFDFYDVLSEVGDAGSRITMSFADDATGIRTVGSKGGDVYYNLQGQPVSNPSKGLYIRNNKVVIVK